MWYAEEAAKTHSQKEDEFWGEIPYLTKFYSLKNSQHEVE